MAWHRWLLRSAAVVTSALAFYFSTGFHTLWPLAWLAPLPVVWMALREDKAAQVHERLASAAREGHAVVVAGFHRSEAAGKRNMDVVFGPDGRALAEYDKTHLVPGFEAEYRPGHGLGLLRIGERTWGTAICKDMDFPRLGRQYSGAGVGLMLVPAWDFVRDGRAHSRMAVLRGVEGGYAIVRTAQDGLVTVSDDRGRIVAEAASSSAPEVLLSAELAPGSGRTFYSRAGDWMGWLSVISTLGLVVSARPWCPIPGPPSPSRMTRLSTAVVLHTKIFGCFPWAAER